MWCYPPQQAGVNPRGQLPTASGGFSGFARPSSLRRARETIWRLFASLPRRLGHDWGRPSAEEVWNELRRLSPMHAGMSYDRLEALGGIQWPCYDESHPGELFLHSRLWQEPLVGPRAQFSVVEFEPPVDALDENYPDPAHHRTASGVATIPEFRQRVTGRPCAGRRRWAFPPKTAKVRRSRWRTRPH